MERFTAMLYPDGWRERYRYDAVGNPLRRLARLVRDAECEPNDERFSCLPVRAEALLAVGRRRDDPRSSV